MFQKPCQLHHVALPEIPPTSPPLFTHAYGSSWRMRPLLCSLPPRAWKGKNGGILPIPQIRAWQKATNSEGKEEEEEKEGEGV